MVTASERVLLWEADGRESSNAMTVMDGVNFVVNGRPDGHVRKDAPTQVWLGLLGAGLPPNPKSAFVIGLGTGSTAGWLAEVASIERVEVAELELKVAPVDRLSKQ